MKMPPNNVLVLIIISNASELGILTLAPMMVRKQEPCLPTPGEVLNSCNWSAKMMKDVITRGHPIPSKV